MQADFAAVASHPAATWAFSLFVRAVIIIDAVVELTQHRQIRRLRMPAVFVGVDVVHLASIGRHIEIGRASCRERV